VMKVRIMLWYFLLTQNREKRRVLLNYREL
jgi:hypothetical protein